MTALTNSCAVIPVADLHSRTHDRQLRLVLCAGEVHAMRPPYGHIRVVFGSAYVSHAGRDIVLASGECATIDSGADVALISALKCRPLVIELHP